MQGPQKHPRFDPKELLFLPNIAWLGTQVHVGGVVRYTLEDAKAKSFVVMSLTMILGSIGLRQLALRRAEVGVPKGCSCFGRTWDAVVKREEWSYGVLLVPVRCELSGPGPHLVPFTSEHQFAALQDEDGRIPLETKLVGCH